MNKSVVIVPLGRFSPPHKEHESLVNAVIKLAKKTHSDTKIFVSRTVDKKKNPLTPQEKIKYLNKMFPGHKGMFDMPPANNPTMIGSLAALSGKYETVHIVLGDDRVAATETLVNKYNGKDFTFDKIVVHSRHSIINTRVGDADGVHASDIRKWAQQGDFDKVRESMSSHLTDTDVKEIMHLIQSRLGSLKESTLDEVFSYYITESQDEPTIVMPSDSDMAKQIEAMSDEELDLQDSDVVMLDVIVGHDIEKENVTEAKVLSIQTRQKLAQRMKGMSKRLARLRQIKAKTMPAQQRLRMRARKAAIMMLRKRATGKKNLDYNSLSKSQRVAVDNALVQRFGKSLNKSVETIAKRIMPMIRKKAQENVKQSRSIKEYVDYPFPKQNKQVPDQKSDNPLNVDPMKLNINTIDPTRDDRTAPDPSTAQFNRNKKLRFKNILNTEGRKSASDKDARDAGDTNIIYQMRKTINSRGEHETVFADGHKTHISVNDAKKMIAKFEALRLPAEKHSFTIAASKSLQAFRNVMSHGIPKDKPKISLGGRQFNEFYLGVGRTRTVSPYDKDEPPGVRNVGEVAKDEDRPTDPNKSRPLSQKLDLLLRLGLSDEEELQKYRRALRSSKKHALQSPQMREALANLLDKLIDLTTKDPATYSRVRYNVMNKEANSLLRKAEESGLPVEIIYEVFARGFEVNNSVNEAFNRVNSFIAGGKAAQMDSDLSEDGKGYKNPTGGLTQKGRDHYNRQTGGHLKAPVTTPPSKLKHDSKAAGRRRSFCARMGGVDGPMKKPNGEPTRKALALRKWNCRSEDNQVDEKRGLWDNIHAKQKRIKSGSGEHMRKPGSKGAPTNAALKASQTETVNGAQQAAIAIAMKKAGKTPKNENAPCWKNYKQIGMKMKGGRSVPNCVPKEEVNRMFETYIGSEPVSKNKNDPKNRFVGTKTIVQNYAATTPGQNMIPAVGQIDQAAFSPIRESRDVEETTYISKKLKIRKEN